jgi:hypothetical protein
VTEESDLERCRRDRWFAHQVLFKRRHPEASCAAHADLVARIHSPEPRFSFEGFRGLGKTTYLEEAAVLRAALGEFRYMVVVSANYRPLALQRIASIKREIEVNRPFQKVFGDMRGAIWQEGQIVLKNGVCIQAIGRDMSVTGLKWHDTRPDALLIDDVEDPDEVRTDVERIQTWDWLMKTLIPSLSHPLTSWIRALGTRRGKGSLPERLENVGWPVLKVPIEHIDIKGVRRATWPEKFPLPVIDQMRANYRGDMHTYAQEYMCQPMSEQDRTFRETLIRAVPREHTFESTWAMYDPARTVGQRSATTGKAVWSYLGRKIVVWAASAHRWMPSEMIEDIFATAERFDPTWVGVEEDGLNEWVREPLRAEPLRRGMVLPVRPVKAPKGKLSFIGGLQPYFDAGDIELAGDFPDLRAQLQSFPHPPIDVPNALAYALRMRPGNPIHDNFTDDHIALDLRLSPWRPLYSCAHARDGWVTAAAVQFVDGALHVLADWAYQGSADEWVATIAQETGLLGHTRRMGSPPMPSGYDALKVPDLTPVPMRRDVVWVAPQIHWDRWMNVGLTQAIGRLPAIPQQGSDVSAGREWLASALVRSARGEEVVQVGQAASWTLKALAGGYCRDQRGVEAETGPYRCLMEGLESWLGLMQLGVEDEGADEMANFAVDRSGRRYRSVMPARH